MNSHTTAYGDSHSPDYPLRWGALVVLLVLTVVAAAIGTIASIAAPSFYLGLNRPEWAPPPNLFGPVWSVLYLMMAIAAWIVVRVRGWASARGAIALYTAQLIANAMWTWLFFYWHSGQAAFADIIVLWLLIVATIATFWRAHWVAGVLLVPYLVWVSFATALTWAVWGANVGVL
jgi:benzodiazapine receptor